MRTPLLAGLLLTAVLGLGACDSTTTFQIGGRYSGITDTSVDPTTLVIDIPDTESGGTFSFTGTRYEGANGQIETPLSGSGTYDHPDVTLTLRGEALVGTASDNGMSLVFFTDAEGSFTLQRLGLN